MSSQISPMAPIPAHGTNDPLWQKRWHSYEPVITPLRCIPLVTNVEPCGAIVAQLADGSHLWITSDGDLPVDLRQAKGFRVTRSHDDNPTVDEVVYDSTPDGEQREHGSTIVPLIQAITAFITERHFVDAPAELFTVKVVGANAGHKARSRSRGRVTEDRSDAVATYGRAVGELEESGFRRVHERVSAEWPLAVLARGHEVFTVFVAHVCPTPPPSLQRDSPADRCNHVIAHPQNAAEKVRVSAALDNALTTGDAHGVLVAAMQLMQPCTARDQPRSAW
ncbi:hypothetical protein ACFVIM_00465 [Streptomyces sp. NPDC057638]|uniref:hypothetical protein n=1 Tax=Streptomyces sp. NPDC057638 TaxID=3346190 RepID=UPI00369ABEB2